ncbi:MAG TPA: sulfite exporter TauE/SafE family protein [Bacteroidia bacterium]|nr:sulfite exporter TauE/SafE family protein [Bacteroidia bacterium]
MLEKYYIFYILAFIAEVLGTISGFGSSILFVPLASIFFDFHLILGITAVFHVFSNLSKIILFRKGVDKRIVLQLGIPAVIFVVLGAWVSKLVPIREMELVLSLLLAGTSVFILLYSSKPLEQSLRNLVGGGIASGFIAGLVGTGGAIRGLVMRAFELEKEIFVASSAFIDMGVDSSRALVYYLNGYMNRDLLYLLPALILISFVGTLAGKRILNRIPQNVFMYIVVGLVLITSLFQAFRFFYST